MTTTAALLVPAPTMAHLMTNIHAVLHAYPSNHR